MTEFNFNMPDDDEVPTFNFGAQDNGPTADSVNDTDSSAADIPGVPADNPDEGHTSDSSGLGEELSDAQVDATFLDLAKMLEQDETVAKTSSALMEAEYIVQNAINEKERARIEYDAVVAERQALEAQLQAIYNRQRALQQKAHDVNSSVRAAEDKKRAAESAHKLAQQSVRVRYERANRSKGYHALAADKAWFKGIEGSGLRILDHQWAGCQFLASAQRAILGDGMGLGKTLTSIAALDLLESKRALIVAQNDITTNFDAEVRMWAPHRSVVNIRGMAKAQRDQILSLGTFMKNLTVIVNYEAWRKDEVMLEKLISMGFDSVILDEAHNIKGTDTNAYLGVKRIALSNNICPVDGEVMPELVDVKGVVLKGAQRMCVKCGWNGQSWANEEMTDEERYYHTKSVKNLFCVTGTPILNKPQDLYALLSLVDPTNFYNKNAFLRDYCEQDVYTGQWKFGWGGADRLMKNALKGRYLARTMEDAGIVLPPQEPVIHNIVMDPTEYPAQYDVIRQLTDHAQIVLSNGKSMSAIAKIALITRQRQANVWPGGISWEDFDEETGQSILVKVAQEVTESIKIDKAIQIISEAVEMGHRVVLFSQFKSPLEELYIRLNGHLTDSGVAIRPVRFDGDTPTNVREQIKSNFNKSKGEIPKWDVVLAHYKVGGTGLNLTACRTTVILDEEWNPGKRDQAYARTHRIGQDMTTFVHVLRLEKTVDTWLARLIQNKQDVIGGFDEAAIDLQEEWLNGFKSGEFNI